MRNLSPLTPAVPLPASVPDQSSIHNNFERTFSPAPVPRLLVSSFAGSVPPYQLPAARIPPTPLTAGTRYTADGRCVDFELWNRKITFPDGVGIITQQLGQATLSSGLPVYPDTPNSYQSAEFALAVPMALLPGLGAVHANPPTTSNPYGAISRRASLGVGISVEAQQQAPPTFGVVIHLLLISNNY